MLYVCVYIYIYTHTYIHTVSTRELELAQEVRAANDIRWRRHSSVPICQNFANVVLTTQQTPVQLQQQNRGSFFSPVSSNTSAPNMHANVHPLQALRKVCVCVFVRLFACT
jgi:hypothetical protein